MTTHTHQVCFGRRVAGCPRCEELENGAAPRQGWPVRHFADKSAGALFRAGLDAAIKRADETGIPCTFGEW